MKVLIIVLLLAGVSGVAFGYWGLNTAQGRARFDEMAGMIPLFGGVAGCAAIFLAFILTLFRLWSARSGE